MIPNHPPASLSSHYMGTEAEAQEKVRKVVTQLGSGSGLHSACCSFHGFPGKETQGILWAQLGSGAQCWCLLVLPPGKSDTVVCYMP